MIRFIATVEIVVEARGLSDAAIVADGRLRDLPYETEHRVTAVREEREGE